uniref:Uncharacterized protein n=1 Tax=Strombidium inclinatum TaxID=197538 RepID=A0A7S3IX12_9SPIT|mmetsp:Transcript_6604/g.10620  ORF Transcript_6604/g.10620 Transcript_6604/m.10620 type:complete len:103 (+) Transcript_6604:82-390(+)
MHTATVKHLWPNVEYTACPAIDGSGNSVTDHDGTTQFDPLCQFRINLKENMDHQWMQAAVISIVLAVLAAIALVFFGSFYIADVIKVLFVGQTDDMIRYSPV